MGSTTAPPAPSIQSILTNANAQAADLVATKSSLSGQDSLMARMFGNGTLTGPRGASAAGATNGLSSVALTPLGSASK